MKQNIEDILSYLRDARSRLSTAEDNQQYMLTLVEVRAWMDELAKELTVGDLEDERYAAIYEEVFCPQHGFSDYDRVCQTIEEYAFDDLPF